MANIIPIRKHSKPANIPSSYRPISLLSCLGKIYERLILSRIQAFLTEREIIPNHQFGFRHGRSTVHQLARVSGKIKECLTQKKSAGMLSVDLQAAFDTIWHAGLMHKLMDLDLPLYLVKLIHSFLQDRKFQVKVGGSTSTPRSIQAGVPQGAVLSPTLFNIYISDIPMIPEVEISQFADDTAILAWSHKTSAVINKLQRASKKLLSYFNRWRIRINGNKSVACLFTKKTAQRHIPNTMVAIGQDEVEWSHNLKYLGLYLDKRLTYKTHVENIVQKTERLVRVLYPLINRKSKLSLQNKVMLYKVIFRPTMSYACPIWSKCARTHLDKLQISQNKILKMMLNVHWRTSTRLVHESCGVEMLKEFIERLTQSFWQRSQFSTDDEIVRIYEKYYNIM